ncbi:MAG: hypothetical protein JXR87_01415 [Candidatus Marinimicrobia bacterium]|nr:hypothetical protein [Candidatus Neomarinimicrobiota bacterium]
MKRTNLKAVIFLAMLFPSLIFAQLHLANETLLNSDRRTLESSMKFSTMASDSFEFDYEKSPGRAFLMSAIIPGAGELYAGAKWRALAFASVEVFSWLMYFNRKNKGEQLETDYMTYADDYWKLSQLYQNGASGYLMTGLTGQHGAGFGSHSIYLEYNGNEYEGNAMSLDTALVGWESFILSGELQPVRTRDYYENIGKYDQFAGGWDDFTDFNSSSDSVVFMSDLRDNYLTQRKESNDALKMATNFATVIMFNHLISAFHAQIAAKNYSSEEADKVSWYMGLVTDVRCKNPVRGLSLSIGF